MVCWHCRYDLAAIDPAGMCPECGFSIKDSTDLFRRQRFPIGRPALMVAATLSFGMAWPLFLFAFGEALFYYAFWYVDYVIEPAVMMLAVVLSAGGWMLIARRTKRDYSRMHGWASLCLIVTCCMSVTLLATFITFLWTATNPTATQVELLQKGRSLLYVLYLAPVVPGVLLFWRRVPAYLIATSSVIATLAIFALIARAVADWQWLALATTAVSFVAFGFAIVTTVWASGSMPQPPAPPPPLDLYKPEP